MRHQERSRAIRRVVVSVALALGMLAPVVPTGAAAAGSPPTAEPNSADRIIFWDGYCSKIAELSDADLRKFRRNGAGGFVCAVRQLDAWGGGIRFAANPDLPALNDPDHPDYERYGIQRLLRDSRIGERARAHDLKLYLAVWSASDLPDAKTPFVDWFDDAAWSRRVVPQFRQMAGAIEELGFAGIAFDHENYPASDNPGGVHWSTGYSGNTHSAAETRAKIRQRGRQVGRAVVRAFPDVEYAAYFTFIPAGWNAYHQYETVGINEQLPCEEGTPTVEFWEGVSSAPGYRAIRFWESVFYKPGNSGTDYEGANQFNTGETYAYFSRCWDTWAEASGRVHVSPFVWIDGVPSVGSDKFNGPYPLDDVDAALQAFSKWGTGGEFANFAYNLTTFDYTAYLAALRDAATPRVVDDEEPELDIDAPATRVVRAKSATTLDLHGLAHDNLAIRSVEWVNDRGGSGSAPMTWTALFGDAGSGYQWQVEWAAAEVPLEPGQNCITVTATDIKGLTTTRRITVNPDGGCAPGT